MVVTIQQVLRPLLITSFLMGLGTYPMEQSNPRIQWIKYFSILYCLTIWFFYAYLLYYALSFFVCETLCDNILFMTILTTTTFTAITSTIMNFYHQKKFEISLKKLSTVEDSLEELGVPKTYQKIQTCSKLVLIGWIVHSLIRVFNDALWFTKSNEIYFWNLILCYTMDHSIIMNLFAELLFIFILWHLHLELCRIVRELNIIFGTQITFGMALNLIHFTIICYGSCMMLMQKFSMERSPIMLFNSIFSFFVLLIRVYTVNYMCESVMDKANKIDIIIHQLTNTLRYADSWQEVYQFTLQVMQRPLKLTGLNLFYLGNECLRKLCITVVTYVIIMVQMKIVLPESKNSV